MREVKTVQISEQQVEGVKARTILWYLVFFGFAINYVVSSNFFIIFIQFVNFFN